MDLCNEMESAVYCNLFGSLIAALYLPRLECIVGDSSFWLIRVCLLAIRLHHPELHHTSLSFDTTESYQVSTQETN